MKKYLMSGVAAIAFLAAFTSCSKSTDLYDQGAVDEKNKQEQQQKTQNAIDQAKVNYTKAFESAFGKVGPNVDWGFSSRNAATRSFTRALGDYDDYKGNLKPSFPSWSSFKEFPKDCAASKFLDEVPKGVNKFPESGGASATSGPFYIDATTTKVEMWNGAGVIYVKGTVDLSSDNCFEIPQNTEIYLLKGSTLKLGTGDANKLKAIIYIESTATLETANRLKMDNTSKVYNHGTINVGAFEVNNTSFLYNVGTLNAPNGLVYVANNGSSIVNDGTIIAGDVEVAGSGHVQNNAEWTVNGTTTVNSDNASWVNNGHWTTDYYSYIDGSENVINNCFLEVKEDFDINLGDNSTACFKIDAGGGVLTKNFNGGKHGTQLSGPYRILMGSNAVFKVTGTAALAASKVGTGDWPGAPTYGYGFYGVGEDYAVFQATHIVKGQPDVPGDKKVQYGGKLYVSAEDHFADPSNTCITFSLGFTKDNIFTTNAEDEYSTGTPNITIQETPCNPGFDGSEPLYRVIAEDLNAGAPSDFDFNDVVFDIVKAEGGKTTLRLQCAGGIYPLKITENDNFEIHKLFGCSKTDVIVNTGRIAGFDYIEHDPVDFDIDGTYTTPEQIKNIKIYVQRVGEEWTELEANRGEAACKILVDSKFTILGEKTDIKTVYTKFPDYVQGTIGSDEFQWWYKQSK